MKPYFIVALIAIAVAMLSRPLNTQPDDKYPRSQAVKIAGSHGMCSGEQVKAPSGQTYVLTAAHCRDFMDSTNSFTVINEAGQSIQRRFIAEDPNSDIMLIEGFPQLEGLRIAKKSNDQDHLRTFTHGHNMDTYKTEGYAVMRQEFMTLMCDLTDPACKCDMPKLKKLEVASFFGPVGVCMLDTTQVAMTARVVPGSSGGMVVNDKNELVGVVSATDEFFGYITDVPEIQKFMAAY